MIEKFKARLVAKGFKQKIWNRLHGDILTGRQIRDAMNGRSNYQALRLAIGSTRRGDSVPVWCDEGESVL